MCLSPGIQRLKKIFNNLKEIRLPAKSIEAIDSLPAHSGNQTEDNPDLRVPQDNPNSRPPNTLTGFNSTNTGGSREFTNQNAYVTTFPGTEADAYKIVNYATLTYCTPRTIKRMQCKPCRRISKGAEVVEIIPEPRLQGRAVLILDKARGFIILAFRGSIQIMNFLQDAQMFTVPVPYAKRARVHSGFKDATAMIMPSVIGPLTKLLNQYPTNRLIITGHSLGGSIAILAAAELAYTKIVPWERMAIFTYGEPRTGNLEFARFINHQRTIVTRVVNENDIVPHITRQSMGYVHHATELYIKNNRTTTCSTKQLEDKRCSLTRFPVVSIISHNQAWDIPLGVFGC